MWITKDVTYFNASNLVNILRDRTVTIDLKNELLTTPRGKVKIHDENQYTFTGDLPNGGHIILTISNNSSISGIIQTDTGRYTINPVGGRIHALIELDPSKVLPGAPVLNNNSSVLVRKNREINPLRKVTSEPAQVDILVAYTSAVKNAHTDIENVISSIIGASNLSFTNSIVDVNWNVVHKMEVSYTETGNLITDLVRFTSKNDNYMEDVHTARSTYNADVCVLITNTSTTWAGVAFQTPASISGAFAVVRYDQAITANYAFTHEVGHLSGAEHDRDTDTNDTFQYGHGYNDTSEGWRTIMSYQTSPATNKVNYWSNPDKPHPITNTHMGTAQYEDNARVLDEYSPTLADFYPIGPPPAPANFTSSDLGHPRLSWDAVIGATSYTISRVDDNGSQLFENITNTYYDDNTVITGEDEIDYEYKVRAETAKGSTDYTNGIVFGGKDAKRVSEIILPKEFGLADNYPNPFNPTTEISYQLPRSESVTLKVYNLMGQEVAELVNEVKNAGRHSVTFDASHLASGTYIYRITAGSYTETRRMVLIK